jgi:hypothetical protein
MSDFAQKPEEGAEAWVERLARIRTEGLSEYLLAVLGNWQRDAAERAAGAKPALPPMPAAAVPRLGKIPATLRRPAAGETTPLEVAKRTVRALSADEMLRFTFWFTHGRAD